jgi:hypothetical protein
MRRRILINLLQVPVPRIQMDLIGRPPHPVAQHIHFRNNFFLSVILAIFAEK